MKQTEEHSSLKENRDPLKEHQSPLEEDQAPLKELDEWDDFVATRYRQGKSEDEFRNYKADANPTVTEFYRQNHKYQTLDFVLKKKAEYCGLKREKKSIWEMAEYLNTLVDDSDPDTDVTQIEHLLQTAETIRKDGHPRWFILAGFLHDGSFSPAFCTTLERCSVCTGSRSGRWSAIRSPSAARIRIRWFFRNFFPQIQIATSPSIRRNMESTSRTAGWIAFTSRLATTNISFA